MMIRSPLKCHTGTDNLRWSPAGMRTFVEAIMVPEGSQIATSGPALLRHER